MGYNWIAKRYSIEELDDYISNNDLYWMDMSMIYIPQYQKLTEPLIERHKDKLNWYCISRYQKLSEDFIERFIDRFDWYNIILYQKLSYGFLEKHLYEYNLFVAGNTNGINIDNIIKLQEKYKDKYYIDKLEYGLNT